MLVAVRNPMKRTKMVFWKHEFYGVYDTRARELKHDPDIYQALEFRKGADMPAECKIDPYYTLCKPQA